MSRILKENKSNISKLLVFTFIMSTCLNAVHAQSSTTTTTPPKENVLVRGSKDVWHGICWGPKKLWAGTKWVGCKITGKPTS